MKDQCEFRVTVLDNANLLQRLAKEFRFLLLELKQSWPSLKADPIGFGARTVLEVWLRLRRAARPTSLAPLAAAMLVVFSALLILVWIGDRSKENALLRRDAGERAQIVAFLPNPEARKEDEGIGAGSQGRVGLSIGKGD
jgi:hypothetical protein